jgi:uncharacterized protein
MKSTASTQPEGEPDAGTSLLQRMQQDLDLIGRTFMPYGKFGPQHFPPDGVPIYDLPAEYLGWFAQKAGFPKGTLGRLLQIVHQMKVDGSDTAFDPFRRARGGRTPLRGHLRERGQG